MVVVAVFRRQSFPCSIVGTFCRQERDFPLRSQSLQSIFVQRRGYTHGEEVLSISLLFGFIE